MQILRRELTLEKRRCEVEIEDYPLKNKLRLSEINWKRHVEAGKKTQDTFSFPYKHVPRSR